MKKNVFFAIFIAMAFSAISQNATYAILFNTKESIIREYQENVFIVYNSDGVDRTVNYVDLNSLVTVSVQLPTVDISDFELYDGYVYFCGVAYNMPIAGLFDVVDLFFNGSPIEYITLTNTLSCNRYPGKTDAVLSLRKIEVMPVPVGNPHLVMVGEANCTNIPDSINRCIVDLYYDGTNWISAVAQAHDGIMYYDDLTVTDNYVVCVGHKHWAEGEYVVPYYRPAPPYDNIFDETASVYGIVPPYFLVYNYLSGGVWSYCPATNEEFLIENLGGDKFATVCHGTSSEYTGIREGTVLNLYDPTFSVVKRYMIPEYSTEYPELKFFNPKESLYLLPGNSSTCPDSYIEYFLDVTTLSVLAANKHTDNTLVGASLSSLDAAPMSFGAGLGQSCLSGDPGNMLHVWRHESSYNETCSHITELSPFFIKPSNGSQGIQYEYSIGNQPAYSYLPPIEIYSVDEKCSE